MDYDILYTRVGSSLVYHERIASDTDGHAIAFLKEKDEWTDAIISVLPTPPDLQ